MNKKHTAKKRFPVVLIVLGVLLLVGAVAIELSEYPWRSLLDIERKAEKIPDPPRIELIGEDSGVRIVDGGNLSPEDAYELLPGSELDDEPPEAYILLGIMKIPKLEVSQYILEGTQRQMRYGGGHVIGTADVGEKGNCAIAAHRTQAFRYLNLLKEGDTIVIKANGNIYTYLVYGLFDVKPTELWVLEPVEGEDYTLTMITCTPYMVSSHRLIVWASLSDINGMTPEEFYAEDK